MSRGSARVIPPVPSFGREQLALRPQGLARGERVRARNDEQLQRMTGQGSPPLPQLLQRSKTVRPLREGVPRVPSGRAADLRISPPAALLPVRLLRYLFDRFRSGGRSHRCRPVLLLKRFSEASHSETRQFVDSCLPECLLAERPHTSAVRRQLRGFAGKFLHPSGAGSACWWLDPRSAPQPKRLVICPPGFQAGSAYRRAP